MQREHDPRTPEHRILELVPGNSAVERQNLHALEQTGLDYATHREGDSVVHRAMGFATLERKPVRLGLWLSWFEAPDDEGVYGPAQASSMVRRKNAAGACAHRGCAAGRQPIY